jgi:dTDP-4-amino-4,6-dideoxygalactose transaminase
MSAPSSAPPAGLLRRVDLEPQFRAYEGEILEAVRRVLGSGRYTLADEGAAFEAAFAEYLGVPAFVGVGDGTRAISMALRLLGVGPGDEVLTVPFTAFPTVAAILDIGATPVFADIDPETYLMTPETMAAALTARTRAVLPVHIFGNVADVAGLQARLAQLGRQDIALVEDAAQAHGSRRNGAMAGSLADFATFSFYPTKNLGGYGDGGGIACRDPEAAARLRRLRNYGFLDKDTVGEVGVNSRLDEVQAAILAVKLRHLDTMNARRRALAALYAEALPELGFRLQEIPPEVETNWHVFEPRTAPEARGRLAAACEAEGIQTNVYYVVPHHLQPALAHLGHRSGDLPGVEAVCAGGLALPLYPELPEGEVHRVIEVLRRHAG